MYVCSPLFCVIFSALFERSAEPDQKIFHLPRQSIFCLQSLRSSKSTGHRGGFFFTRNEKDSQRRLPMAMARSGKPVRVCVEPYIAHSESQAGGTTMIQSFMHS